MGSGARRRPPELPRFRPPSIPDPGEPPEDVPAEAPAEALEAGRVEVPVSRRRGGLAATRGDWQRSERSFFCRSCQMTERGLWVPAGWYLLERAPGGQGRHLRLGLYCSLECLMQAAGTLAEGAAEHAGRLGVGGEAEHARSRARILETAQTLLAGGMTVRQAGDKLGVPTAALKTWLAAAGINVGAAAEGSGPVSYVGGSDPQTNPIGCVNELRQRNLLAEVKWGMDRSGAAHEPVFTATVTAMRGGREVSGSGSAATKAAAKAEAARALLTNVERDAS